MCTDCICKRNPGKHSCSRDYNVYSLFSVLRDTISGYDIINVMLHLYAIIKLFTCTCS